MKVFYKKNVVRAPEGAPSQSARAGATAWAATAVPVQGEYSLSALRALSVPPYDGIFKLTGFIPFDITRDDHSYYCAVS